MRVGKLRRENCAQAEKRAGVFSARAQFSLAAIRDLTILGRQRDGQNKLLQINGSKDSSSYIINRMNLIQL